MHPEAPFPPSTLLLLHLPPPPASSPQHLIRDYYQPPIAAALDDLVSTGTAPHARHLTVAIHAPFLHPTLSRTRGDNCEWVQRILTAVYSDVSVELKKRGKEDGVVQDLVWPKESDVVAPANLVDVRLVFYWDDYADGRGLGKSGGAARWKLGPVFPVSEIIGDSVRSDAWVKVVYVVEKHEGRVVEERRPEWVGSRTVGTQEPRVVEYTPAPLPSIPSPSPLVMGCDQKPGEYEDEVEDCSLKTHNIVIVGGTFDHLHSGHKLLLTTTLFVLDPPSSATATTNSTLALIIGLTGPLLLENKKHSEYLQPWLERAHNVLTFIFSILTFSPWMLTVSSFETDPNAVSILIPESTEANPCTSSQTMTTSPTTATSQSLITTVSTPCGGKLNIEIVEIHDPFGPTITNPQIQALVVSEETRGGGLMVNQKRREQGWSELDVFAVGVVMEGGGDQAGEKMSSTEIRKRRGEEKG